MARENELKQPQIVLGGDAADYKSTYTDGMDGAESFSYSYIPMLITNQMTWVGLKLAVVPSESQQIVASVAPLQQQMLGSRDQNVENEVQLERMLTAGKDSNFPILILCRFAVLLHFWLLLHQIL